MQALSSPGSARFFVFDDATLDSHASRTPLTR
ncbi:hypothetical protein Rmet_6702 (plasmid) [Cupriavidus metallidurans CH34]|uniref:Uncharacterized protein n=1 Tax=Cupriavidus metallidurans (strain ATCC 43123 / DSM 2839 / NBRC 102507 / CH34) TaxID=266264 RepID=D3DYB4_CUPMC|nr:hypothetical protein Rmet_6702 [Cupriavidus metallidurans CH34]